MKNKWQQPLLQKDEQDVPLKVWEVLLYGGCLVVLILFAVSKL